MFSRKSRTSRIESLEPRTLFTTAPIPWPLTVNEVPQPDGTVQLQVIAVMRRNAISIAPASGGFTIINAGAWSDTVVGTFSSILIRAGAAQDSLAVDPSVTTPCIIYGGRNDTLTGGSGNDQIFAGLGKSVINAGAGDDVIVTIAGRNSLVYGGAGFDNFWVGRSDHLLDVSQDETNVGAVHQIGSFLGIRLPGSRRAVKVPMTLNGQLIPEPVAENALTYAGTRGYPLFGPDGAATGDIHQHALGDCYFLSTLSSIANVDPAAMPQSIAALGDGTYVVEFFRSGVPVYVREDGLLPVDSTGTVVYGDLGWTTQCTWVALMEKAYAYFRTGIADYGTLAEGRPSEVYDALNFAYTDSTPTSEGAFVQTLLADQQAGRAAVFGTNQAPTDPQLVPGHAYMVNMVVNDSTGAPAYLELRNPWGTDINGDATNDGYVDITLADAFASMMDYCSVAV